VAQLKGKGKRKGKPTPEVPSLRKEKGKGREKAKRKTSTLICSGLFVFLLHRAGRGLAESACPLTSWPPVAIPLKQII
jgi:hypothetical protein